MRVPPPNNLISAQFTQNIADLRQRITVTAEEAVTGRHSDLTAHLSGRIGTAMLSQKAVESISFQREQISIRESRLDVTQRSLTSIHDRALGLDTSMLSALGAGSEVSQGLAARDSKAALNDIFSALNVRYGERFLFSGDATATRPFSSADDMLTELRAIADTATDSADFQASLDTYFNTPGGGWLQNVYAGALTASDPDAVVGNNSAIVEMVRGLAVMALADPADQPAVMATDSSIVNAAAMTLTSGLSNLTTLRADRGVIQEQIETEKKSLEIEETIFTAAFNSLTARDTYEAAAALKELEATLEASYLLTSRLSSLSLLNYLR